MMRLLLLLFLFSFFYSCLNDSKKVVVVHPEGYYKEVYMVKDDSVRHGSYLKYYGNGILADSCQYFDNKIEGLRKLYTREGKLEISESYSNGIFEGPYTTYYNNGQPKKIQNYVANMIQGEVKEFYEDGTLKGLIHFKDNFESGPFSEYFENGKLHWKGRYEGGDFEQDTLWEYNPDGELIRKLFCIDGICQTIWKPETGTISPKKIFKSEE